MHDKNGKPLTDGDKVTLTCVIRSCTGGPDYCNIMVETVEPMFPGEHKTSISLNAKQVEKINSD